MDKRIRIAGIIAALAISIIILTSPSTPPPIPQPNTIDKSEFVEILATDLEKPWAIDFAGDRIFVTEQTGQIRVVDSDILLEKPLATFRTADTYGGGLLGIAVHPDFVNNNFLYVYLTYEENEQLWNKILRITESQNKLLDVTTILDRIPGSKFDNGGVLKFGPDDKLYIGTGTPSENSHAPQDLDSLGGKILRINYDGSIPTDNPFENSPIFSYGHKNPRGMAWDSVGNFFVVEQGPSVNDEINLVRAGMNYGWPEQQCSGSEFENAIKCFDPGIEPGGIVFYTGDKLDFKNSLIMATLRASNLYTLELNENIVTSQSSIMSGFGRIRDVNQGPDGYLYIISSNTDGKGFPDGNDDKLVRLLK